MIVMTNRAAPLILGIEWIDAMRATVNSKDGKKVVNLMEVQQKHKETRENPVCKEQKLSPRRTEINIELPRRTGA